MITGVGEGRPMISASGLTKQYGPVLAVDALCCEAKPGPYRDDARTTQSVTYREQRAVPKL